MAGVFLGCAAMLTAAACSGSTPGTGSIERGFDPGPSANTEQVTPSPRPSAATPRPVTSYPSPTRPGASSASPSADGDTVDCTYIPTGAPAKPGTQPPNGTDVHASGTLDVTARTNLGILRATLDRAAAPCAINSLISLADQGYYDDSPCHRLTASPTLQVLQCGDPSGTGSGSPGYRFADELTGKETYPAGTVAMANSGPDRNGSQFFIVYGAADLPPDYTVIGTVDSDSLLGIKQIAAAGVKGGGADGPPAMATTILSIAD